MAGIAALGAAVFMGSVEVVAAQESREGKPHCISNLWSACDLFVASSGTGCSRTGSAHVACLPHALVKRDCCTKMWFTIWYEATIVSWMGGSSSV
jgi:hypothetical protein